MRLLLLLTLVIMPLTSVQSYPVDSVALMNSMKQTTSISIQRRDQIAIAMLDEKKMKRAERAKRIDLIRNRQASHGMHFFCFLALLKNRHH